MTAIESASRALAPESLLRFEVDTMVQRLKMGVMEDKSIGSFGENIYHPEIELFVQALILSRRVGGTLSHTLERLSKQSRKRQFFRGSANAAVSVHRTSIWVILGILAGVDCYIYVVYPELVTDAWADDFGWLIWQGAIILSACAFLWIQQTTKIKI